MIEDCIAKESFEMAVLFYKTTLFALKWMVKVNDTIQDRITNENFNNYSVQKFYSLSQKTAFMILFKII